MFKFKTQNVEYTIPTRIVMMYQLHTEMCNKWLSGMMSDDDYHQYIDNFWTAWLHDVKMNFPNFNDQDIDDLTTELSDIFS